MSVSYIDPRAEPATPPVPYELSVDIATGDLVLGLLSNSFQDSERFLELVAAELSQTSPSLRTKRWTKASVSVPVSETDLGQMTAQCRAVVTAWGH
jgi:hypothetical protein